jgi:peptidoglycan-associated lipoprotein
MSLSKIFGSQKAIVRGIAAVLLVIAVSGAGCSKKEKTDEGLADAAADANLLGDSDSGKAGGLQTVNFPYDSFSLTEDGKAKLKANADLLKDKASVKIQVEGHCDQRGGIQYNIALGEKRANAVKSFMQELGVSADRITTISYGKERVLDARETEDSYAKNRRANFVITSK